MSLGFGDIEFIRNASPEEISTGVQRLLEDTAALEEFLGEAEEKVVTLETRLVDMETELTFAKDEGTRHQNEVAAQKSELELANEQVETLRREANANMEASGRREEMRLLEQLRSLQLQVQGLETSLAEKDATINDNDKALERARDEGRAEATLDLTEAEKKIALLNDKVGFFTSSADKLKEEVKNLQDELTASAVRLTEAKTQISDLEIKAGSDKIDLNANEAEQRAAELQLQLTNALAAFDTLSSENETLKVQCNQYSRKYIDAQGIISRNEIQIGQEKAQRETLQDKIEARQRELDKKETAMTESHRQHNLDSSALQSKLDEKLEQLMNVENELQFEKSKNETLLSEAKEHNAKNKDGDRRLQEMKENFDAIRQNQEKRETTKNEEVNVMREELRLVRQEYSIKADKLRKSATEAEEARLAYASESQEKLSSLTRELTKVTEQLHECESRLKMAQSESSHNEQQASGTSIRLKDELERRTAEVTAKTVEITRVQLQLQEEREESVAEKARMSEEIFGLKQRLEQREQGSAAQNLKCDARIEDLEGRVEQLVRRETDLVAEVEQLTTSYSLKLSAREESWRSSMMSHELQSSEAMGQRDAEIRDLKLRVNEAEFSLANNIEKLSRQDDAKSILEHDRTLLETELEAQRQKFRDLARQHSEELYTAEQRFQDLDERYKQLEHETQLQVAEASHREEAISKQKDEITEEATTLRMQVGTLRQELQTQRHAADTELQESLKSIEDQLVSEKDKHTRYTTDHQNQLESLKSQLHQRSLELKQQTDQTEVEMDTVRQQHTREMDELRLVLRKAEELGIEKGQQASDRTNNEKVRILQTTLDQLRAQQQKERTTYEVAEKKHEDQIEQWKRDFAKEKHDNSLKVMQQKEELKLHSDRILLQLKEASQTNQEGRKTIDGLETALSKANQSLQSYKAEATLQHNQAEIRMKDQDTWHKQQLQGERNRREKAEAEAAEAREEVTNLEKFASENDSRSQSKSTRLERQVATANRDMASANAKVEGLRIQLEERDRALKNAGLRISALSHDRPTSPSPRRATPAADAEAMFNRQSARAQSVELELFKERNSSKHNARQVEHLQEELRQSREDAETAEAKAEQIAEEHERIERDFRAMHSDVSVLKAELELTRQRLNDGAAEHKEAMEKATNNLKDAKARHEVETARLQTEVSGVKEALRRTEEEVTTMSAEVEELRKKNLEEVKTSGERRRDVQQEVHRRDAELRDLRKQLVQSSQALQQANDASQSLRIELERLKSSYSQVQRDLQAAREGTRRANSEAEALKGQCIEAQQDASRASRRMVHLENTQRKETDTLKRDLTTARSDAKTTKAAVVAQVDADMHNLVKESCAVRARLRRVESEQSEYSTKVHQMQAASALRDREAAAVKRRIREADNTTDVLREELSRTKLKESCLKRQVSEGKHARKRAEEEVDVLQSDLRGQRHQVALAEGAAHRLVHEAEAAQARTNSAWERAHVASVHQSLSEKREATTMKHVTDMESQMRARIDDNALSHRLTNLSSATRLLSELVSPRSSFKAYP